MRKFIKICFDKWWRPILLWFATCLTLGLSEIFRNRVLGNIAFALFGIGLLVVLISAIYLFTRKKWVTGLLSLGIFGGTIAAFIFYAIAILWIE
ncbi:MAG: hypothetical protein KIT66_06545 [Chitinophagaceae bacterium]|nr:hypothetical protein [Chitinophagaceae bacterium]